MSTPTKHRAASTHSGRSRNDESSHAKRTSDAAQGTQLEGRKAEGGKKAPAPHGGKH